MGKNRKTFYLIRHGEIQSDGKRCIGTTEVPLSSNGVIQAQRLGIWMTRLLLRENSIDHIYVSPLMRCRDTAKHMLSRMPADHHSVSVREELHEIKMGEWENMRFSDIKMRYPKSYTQRGENFWSFKAPGGESFEEAGKRMVTVLKELASIHPAHDREDSYFIISHAGVIRGALAYLGEIDPDRLMQVSIPYASVTKVVSEENGGKIHFNVEYIGSTPAAVPNDDEITGLLDRYHVPAHIRRHMKGVANVLMDILDMLDPDCVVYDRALFYAAAMLHDFARLDKNHSSIGALKLRLEGYELIADIISEHDDPELHRELSFLHEGHQFVSDEDLLYYADKRVLEDTVVSLKERFQASLSKCRTPEARMNHTRRWNKAIAIENDIFRYFNKSFPEKPRTL